ncbi:MAG: IS4 family transposase [Myxococcales bacterium]|nr:IS4 family transposase [Myxococcales bacterium]
MGQHTSIRTQLRALVPASDIRRQARLCGAVKRHRTIDIVEFLMATVVLVCGRGGQTIASMRRGFSRLFGAHVARSSFWSRFSAGFQRLVSWLLERLTADARAQQPALTGRLKPFTDVLAADSTVIKVHDDLASVWRGTRSSRAAALKVHTLIRATTGQLLRRSVTAEARNDAPEFKVGHWARGCLFLFDRGYSSASLWWRVHRLNGYFVTRLSKIYTARITAVNRRHRGRARGLVGRPFKEAIVGLKRSFIDVQCSFRCETRPYRSNQGRRFVQEFRVVGIWQPAERRYLLLVTNLKPASWSPTDVAELYRLRTEVETSYKTGKSGLGLNELPSSKEHIVRTLIDAALIRAQLAMAARSTAERHLPPGRWINPGQWVTVWREVIADAITDRPIMSWKALARLGQDPNVGRRPLRMAVAGGENEHLCGLEA